MRISDWRSDVCSSELPCPAIAEEAGGESAGSAHGVRRRAGRLAAVRGVEGAASSARADHLGRNGALTRRGRARAVPPGPSRDDLEATACGVQRRARYQATEPFGTGMAGTPRVRCRVTVGLADGLRAAGLSRWPPCARSGRRGLPPRSEE